MPREIGDPGCRIRQALGEGVQGSPRLRAPGRCGEHLQRGVFHFPYPQPEGVPWKLPRCPGHGSRQTASVTQPGYRRTQLRSLPYPQVLSETRLGAAELAIGRDPIDERF
jgi:hypothetical protein